MAEERAALEEEAPWIRLDPEAELVFARPAVELRIRRAALAVDNAPFIASFPDRERAAMGASARVDVRLEAGDARGLEEALERARAGSPGAPLRLRVATDVPWTLVRDAMRAAGRQGYTAMSLLSGDEPRALPLPAGRPPAGAPSEAEIAAALAAFEAGEPPPPPPSRRQIRRVLIELDLDAVRISGVDGPRGPGCAEGGDEGSTFVELPPIDAVLRCLSQAGLDEAEEVAISPGPELPFARVVELLAHLPRDRARLLDRP